MGDRDTMRLCYVDDHWAWFTPIPLAEQWGDDWDDAPYEHNAGDPYWHHGADRTPHELFVCAWREGQHWAWLPNDDTMNSEWSVRDINAGKVPWVRMGGDEIYAGTTFAEFREIMRRHGCTLYLPEGDDA